VEPRIVGLAGYAGAGKDTAGTILVRDHHYTRVAFADAVKHLARSIGWNGQKDTRGRVLLQRLGSGCRDVFGADCWIRRVNLLVDEALMQGRSVVITDVRHVNEVKAIRLWGGEVWRVVRPGVGPANDHESERALDAVLLPALVNDGSLEDLAVQVARLVKGKEEVA
jgi:hypothetical protein